MAGSMSGTRTGHDAPDAHKEVQSGWTVFAAVMMIFGGAMAILEGIAALAKDDLFVSTSNYVFKFSLTGWGWVHLILGIVVVLAGCALFTGALWARAVGVVLAGLLAIANFLWLPYYPFWSIVLIAINVFIIWALCSGSQKARA
ncbi:MULTISPECIES: hypothetical protein [unclassified Streptomyces]|uniref:DUF7144 family membrane protein n=1 Tax=unclassified Streptomyces TaxID=2593676 RepID=UPI002E331B35|nr:hypothetical protein [Streptomyces sp. NBC_00683]WSY29095.1 hypothetical protein OG844_04775 [Streptomyces sp. NBC_00887]WSY35602.1 hypothetical protein OG844_40825 [Streptomyces sp. NBC_00887]